MRLSRFRPGVLFLVGSLLACAGGNGGRRDAGSGGEADSGPRPGVDAGPGFDAGPRPDTGPLPPSCNVRAELIYVIDRDRVLSSFDPRTNAFTRVGPIACAGSGRSPFSMSIDREANAWILFDDGRVRLVSTADGSCSADAIDPGAPFERFGMGFAADVATGGEHLYISGGRFLDLLEQLGPASLGEIDLGTRRASAIGELRGWPELTGNIDGQLFAFYPSDVVFSTFTPGRIEELNPSTGAAIATYTLDTMTGEFAGQYAFAYWGARLYIFVRPDTATNSEVWRFDLPPMGDGSVTRVVADTGNIIVGAGVSICAPDVLF